MIPFYLITNVGTLLGSPYAQAFPRQFILAHVYNAAPNSYRQLLAKVRDRGSRIILDNGAYEGQLVLNGELIVANNTLKPDVLCLPDLIGCHWKKSKEAALKFLKCKMRIPENYMYIPQGENVAQTLEAFDDAYRWCDPAKVIIGIGKCYRHWCSDPDHYAFEEGRYEMIKDILSIQGASEFRFHLLGGRLNPTQRFTQWTNCITGMDAYDPCHCALTDTVYPATDTSENRVDHLSLLEPPGIDSLEQNVDIFCNYYGLNTGLSSLDS